MKTCKITMAAVALMVLVMAGSAMADITEAFTNGFTDLEGYTQQDKRYGDFQDVGVNRFLDMPGETTTIKTQTFTGLSYIDLHTVSFSGLWDQNGVYDIKYTIEVIDGSDYFINGVGLGMNQSAGSGAPATLRKQVWTDGFGGNLRVRQNCHRGWP